MQHLRPKEAIMTFTHINKDNITSASSNIASSTDAKDDISINAIC